MSGSGGVNADVKVGCVVAGMAAGADSIDDLDVLRHGAMAVMFGGIREPSTLGTFLRSFTWGNARAAPLLPGKQAMAFVDVDSCQKRVFGYRKQGAAFGHTKISGKSLLVRGLNVLAATISTPRAAPVTAAVRLRGGNAGSARGAASFITEAVGTARDAGCTGTIVVRMDSAFYSSAAVWAARGAGACFSVTAQLNASVKAAIAAIGAGALHPSPAPWSRVRRMIAVIRPLVSAARIPESSRATWADRHAPPHAIIARNNSIGSSRPLTKLRVIPSCRPISSFRSSSSAAWSRRTFRQNGVGRQPTR
jgi:hypothetical protein